jgi:hypothetical protein
MKKKYKFLIVLIFMLTSCAEAWDSTKRGLTGQKAKSTDEFLVEKKDPLILPPDFENLPSPSEALNSEEISSFEKKLSEDNTGTEVTSSGSTEESIVEKIRSQ